MIPDPLTVTFAPGETRQTISVPIVEEEATNEPDETFRITLTSVTNALLPAEGTALSATAIGTIQTDDDPVVFISPVGRVVEGERVEIEIIRTASNNRISVFYEFANGTGANRAIHGSDFRHGRGLATTVLVNMNTGQAKATIQVDILNDTNIEDDETFTVKIDSPTVRSGGGSAPALYVDNATGQVPSIGGNGIVYAVAEPITIVDTDSLYFDIEDADLTDAGNNAEFPLKANRLPTQNPVDISYTPSESGSSFLTIENGKSSGQQRVQPVMFREINSEFIGTLTVPTQNDKSAVAGGTIAVRLDSDSSGTDYKLTTDPTKKTNAQAKIQRIPPPVLSFLYSTYETEEGNSIAVIVSADKNPGPNLDVRFTPTETGTGNFLLAKTEPSGSKGSGDIRTETLNFSQTAPWKRLLP